MNKSHLIFLDTETTGLGAEDRLCQVAYSFDGKEVESLFRPSVPITVDAMAVTHITNKMVADKEVFVGSPIYNTLKDILVAGNILVAHNAPFDVEMLKRENLETKKSIDTFKIAHHLDESGAVPKYSLQYLRYYHDLEVEDASAHDALGDVRVLQKLFDFYFSQMLTILESEEAVLEKMLEVSSHPVLLKKFNFGKYIGMNVSQVAQENADYLAWLLNQKIMSRERGEDNDENWIYTLDYYLKPKAARS